MIQPGCQDLYIQRGEDFIFQFDIKIDDVVLDLTGATITSQITEQDYGGTAIEDFKCEVDGVVSPNPAPTANLITLSLTDAQTLAITQDGGYYDVLVTDAAGIDTYYLKGKVFFVNTVTRKA